MAKITKGVFSRAFFRRYLHEHKDDIIHVESNLTFRPTQLVLCICIKIIRAYINVRLMYIHID